MVAAKAVTQFDKIHLLSFYHSGIPLIERAKINVERLKNKYGENRFIHKTINIEEIFKTIYYKTYYKDLKRYQSYITSCSCDACQLAMHTATIIYNIKNNIEFAFDGYKKEKQHLYAFMSEAGIQEIKKFYQKFGIQYENPVYDIVRTDWVLYELGITPKKNVKFPSEGLNFSTQHHCHNGILVNAYLMSYYIPKYGEGKGVNISMNYWKEKLEILKPYILEEVDHKTMKEWEY